MFTVTKTYLEPAEVIPLKIGHGGIDQSKVERIALDMKEHGWQGRPILAVEVGHNQALTGSHRLHSASLVDIMVPVKLLETDSWEGQEGDALDALTRLHGDDQRLTALLRISKEAASLMALEIQENDAK